MLGYLYMKSGVVCNSEEWKVQTDQERNNWRDDQKVDLLSIPWCSAVNKHELRVQGYSTRIE